MLMFSLLQQLRIFHGIYTFLAVNFVTLAALIAYIFLMSDKLFIFIVKLATDGMVQISQQFQRCSNKPTNPGYGRVPR